MNLHTHSFDLKLRHAFAISRESRTVQKTLIVELEEDGFRCFGEATANTYYGVTIPNMIARLETLRPIIESYQLTDARAFWEDMHPYLREEPFLQCALDIAAHDLVAQKKRKPLYKLWGLSLNKLPISNYTIGIAPIDKMVEKMQEQPWPIYKIKLGTDEDLQIIEALRAHTNAAFRVDANCAWTPEQTIEYAPELKKLGVEFIEQPLPAENWEGMKEVFTQSALPVIADESCRIEADVTQCHQHFHGINIKLMKCGGLTPALRMIDEGRKLGLQLMVGCMTESSVGISAIGHLLPFLDYVDMDGAMLLSNDPATGVRLKDGMAVFPERNGTGVQLLNS